MAHAPMPIEPPMVKTKIIATVGPACADLEALRDLVLAGVDVFRLNFAHGTHDWHDQALTAIRQIEVELDRPIGILGDLAGPKIRLGEIDSGQLLCQEGATVVFVKNDSDGNAEHKVNRTGDDGSDPVQELTCSYAPLIDDVQPGDRILLADGIVELIVTAEENNRVICQVVRPGTVRSRQGVNLPGVALSTPSVTDKDRDDLTWALDREIDFIGLSFVRNSDDIRRLRDLISRHPGDHQPHIVAKIEKGEAIADLEAIIDITDAVMVARGDLGVEVDLATVPILQKQIIRMANAHRVPVITATQMLDSMTNSEFPTRAEASDVANATLDGTDAVMLSGETAIGQNPTAAVAMMSRIVSEAEQSVDANVPRLFEADTRAQALEVTEAATVGAVAIAEQLDASLLVIPTLSGRTALAVSKERSPVPVLALSDSPTAARRMNLYWGVRSLGSIQTDTSPRKLLDAVCQWGRQHGVLETGQRLVLVGSSNWSAAGHDLVMVHSVPPID
jgi:pyruvate kinase